jgi:3-hydroxybutyryl-CoA dehydrogenase
VTQPQQPRPGPNGLSHICVVGAGTMGRGVAQVAVAAGHPVSLVDPDSGQLAAAVADIHSRLQRRRPEIAASLETRLRTVTSLRDAPADPETVVIEAAVENLDVKRSVFALALEHFGEAAILATNTSSLSITEIAAGTESPPRVVGMHFFNPVPAMRLVEVVCGLDTDPVVATAVADLATSWGKVVAHVRSAPGFIVNRVARPFYGESLRLVEEGAAPPETIDELLRSAGGFRMGPFELMDLIGNDVNSTVTETVWRAFGFDPRYAPSQLQRELVAAGRFGRKSGRGFYSYGPHHAPPVAVPAESPAPVPDEVTLHADCPQLAALLARAGVRTQVGTLRSMPRIDLGDLGVVVVTRGRTARQESDLVDRPVAVLDRCLDPDTVDALAIAVEDEALRDAVVGLLGRAGVRAFPIDDTPGLVVARVVSMIANEAWEAAHVGIATPEDIDSAMVLGTNYPLGPFAWSRRWSEAAVLQVLDELHAEYGDTRYRASRRLRASSRPTRGRHHPVSTAV